MALALDISPLRASRQFRNLWFGSLVSAVGSQFTTFAAMYTVWTITRSSLDVGLLGLASGVPLVVIALAGTGFIDSVDRAKLARVVNALQSLNCLGLAATAALHSPVGLIILTGVSASLNSIGGPARRALTPVVVSPAQLSAAYALSSMSFQLSIFFGPALASVVVANVNAPTCFLIDSGTFALMVLTLSRISHPVAGRNRGQAGVHAAVAGLRWAWQNPAVRAALLSDLAATVLAMPMAAFPELNQVRFGGKPETLALFTTAVAVGGMIGSFVSGPITRATSPGKVMSWCAASWGLAILAAGLVPDGYADFAFLGIAGMVDTWSVVSRSTLVQTVTTDDLRGRISSLEQIVGVGGPNLGNFRAGFTAGVFGPAQALAIGGAACVVATVAIAATHPALRRFKMPHAQDSGAPDSPPDSPEQQELSPSSAGGGT
jgi:Transmembrane secretion effector